MSFMYRSLLCTFFSYTFALTGPPLKELDGQVPYLVSVQHSVDNETWTHICGGGIIFAQWVLTAAYCELLHFGTYRVVYGTDVLLGNNIKLDFKFARIYSHHKYKTTVLSSYDIALAKLEEPLTFNARLQPLALPSFQDDCVREAGIVSGWGQEHWWFDHLSLKSRSIFVPVLSPSRCREMLQHLEGTSELLEFDMICTGTDITGKAICHGDRGNPLVVKKFKDRPEYKVLAIATWFIEPCGLNDAPSLFINVCKHLRWILEITRPS